MATNEALRREVQAKLEELRTSTDGTREVSFPCTLSAEERKYIHTVASRWGLKTHSRGNGEQRYITVFAADPEGSKALKDAGADRLVWPAECWEILSHELVESAADSLEELSACAPLQEVGAEDVVRLLNTRRATPSSSSSQKAPRQNKSGGAPESKLVAARKKLPAWAARAEVLKAVSSAQVVICIGETGCGKSTQVPQFLLEEEEGAQIVVTQPRRIAAISLATRVAEERGEQLGDIVGYSVHLDHQQSEATRLLYCTTGVFRRKLLVEPTLQGVTHLVLDELHERDKITDFVLIAVRHMLKERPDMKVILMSATLQQDTFKRYFEDSVVVTIPGRTYPVHRVFMEEIAPVLHKSGHWKRLGPGFAAGGLGFGSWNNRDQEKTFKYKLSTQGNHADGLCGFAGSAKAELAGDRLQEGLWLHDVAQCMKGVQYDIAIIEALLLHLFEKQSAAAQSPLVKTDCPQEGAVLVFLPGWEDISRVKKRLYAHPVLGDMQRFLVLPLHSQLPREKQQLIFGRPPKGVRKIVLSTNIAETSLTIDDVSIVIDCGRTKEVNFDAFLGIPTLNTAWICAASAAQRAGRAGRTAPGTCYHLYSMLRKEMFQAHTSPEMLRSNLEDVFLHAKLLLTRTGHPDITAMSYLQQAPDPPDEKAVSSAARLLQSIGALSASDADGSEARLTALGTHLAGLPLLPQVAKVVVWACMLGVGQDAVTLVSALQYRDPFSSLGAEDKSHGQGGHTAVQAAKRALCGSTDSDHLALLQAARIFESKCKQGGDAAHNFCKDHCLSFGQMCSLRQTATSLRREMEQRGLWPDISDRNKGDFRLLCAAICAGMFPNIAKRPAGGGAQIKVQNGQLDARAHASSVLASSGKGSQSGMRLLDDRQHPYAGKGGADWLCFNDLSQVEDYFSASGLSKVPLAALLLLCGEGPLVVEDLEQTSKVSSGRAISAWWQHALSRKGSTNGGKKPSAETNGEHGDDVIISLAELQSWLSFQVTRATSRRLGGLRAMLQLLFRAFCGDMKWWKELMQAGNAGSAVLDLLVQLIRSEVGTLDAPSSASAEGGKGKAKGSMKSGGKGGKSQASHMQSFYSQAPQSWRDAEAGFYSHAPAAASHSWHEADSGFYPQAPQSWYQPYDSYQAADGSFYPQAPHSWHEADGAFYAQDPHCWYEADSSLYSHASHSWSGSYYEADGGCYSYSWQEAKGAPESAGKGKSRGKQGKGKSSGSAGFEAAAFRDGFEGHGCSSTQSKGGRMKGGKGKESRSS